MADGRTLQITREDHPTRGRYVAALPRGEAELTYTRRGPGVVSADHTGVPTEAEGQGVGSALVARLFADAAAEGFKVVPRCPFVAAAVRRHPEWADLTAST